MSLGPPRDARSRLRPGACLAAVALVVACSSGGGSSTIDVGELPTIRTLADVQLPMDHYLFDPHDSATVETAKDELVAECMARQGFAGYPVPDFSARVELPAHALTGIAVGVDVDQARDHGFTPHWVAALEAESEHVMDQLAGWGGPEVSQALSGPGPSSASEDGDARAGESSVFGPLVPAGGCIEEAHRELYELAGVEPSDNTWAGAAAAQAISAAGEDRRLDGPRQAWSECMTARGYDYPDPDSAAGDERWMTDEAGARQAAVDSAECVRESRYLDTNVAIAAGLQQEFIEANAERLEEERATRQALLEAIRAHGLGNIGGRSGGALEPGWTGEGR